VGRESWFEIVQPSSRDVFSLTSQADLTVDEANLNPVDAARRRLFSESAVGVNQPATLQPSLSSMGSRRRFTSSSEQDNFSNSGSVNSNGSQRNNAARRPSGGSNPRSRHSSDHERKLRTTSVSSEPVIPATDGKNERSSDRKPKNATTTTDK
jgi:hypothetical protein